MKKFISEHFGSLRRKNRDRESKAPTLAEANPFTIPRSVSYRKANPRLPEPRKVASLGSVRRPSRYNDYRHQSVDISQPQEVGRPLAKSSSRENPPWAIAAGPKLKQKVSHSPSGSRHHRRVSEQHPALRQGGANLTERDRQTLKISPPIPLRPEETGLKPRQEETNTGGYGQTLDTAKFREIPDGQQPSRGPVEEAGDGREAAQLSTEYNSEIADEVGDISRAVERELDLTNTVDCDRITKHLPGK